eukprot:CCRYP_007250-RA/>CCRYP_007250-RA protein AED:0.47 eAED:0.48 QI:0/0.5/0.66/1/0/0/3/437/66
MILKQKCCTGRIFRWWSAIRTCPFAIILQSASGRIHDDLRTSATTYAGPLLRLLFLTSSISKLLNK